MITADPTVKKFYDNLPCLSSSELNDSKQFSSSESAIPELIYHDHVSVEDEFEAPTSDQMVCKDICSRYLHLAVDYFCKEVCLCIAKTNISFDFLPINVCFYCKQHGSTMSAQPEFLKKATVVFSQYIQARLWQALFYWVGSMFFFSPDLMSDTNDDNQKRITFVLLVSIIFKHRCSCVLQ